VVDTVGVKSKRPFAMVDIYGTPYTESLHVVERYRLVDYETTMCPFRNFLNLLNRLDSKGGDLIRGVVTDVDA